MIQFQFDFTGPQLRDAGISLAAESAENKQPGWNEKAYQMLLQFIQTSDDFMCEDFRQWAYSKGLSEPPSHRAFGSVITKASRANVITHVGYKSVSNAKAHCANASVWRANNG